MLRFDKAQTLIQQYDWTTRMSPNANTLRKGSPTRPVCSDSSWALYAAFLPPGYGVGKTPSEMEIFRSTLRQGRSEREAGDRKTSKDKRETWLLRPSLS